MVADKDTAPKRKSAPSLAVAIHEAGNDKQIARLLGVSVRQASRYRIGHDEPRARSLVRLMRYSDGIFAAVLRMVHLDDASMDRLEIRLQAQLREIQLARRASDAEGAEAASGSTACGVVGPHE